MRKQSDCHIKTIVPLGYNWNPRASDCSVVHDIGKVAVPEPILLKPGPLTPEERTIMQQHPVVGHYICAPLRSFRLVLPIVPHHHEQFDGSGYPDGLKGVEVDDIFLRLLAILANTYWLYMEIRDIYRMQRIGVIH